MKRFLLSLVMLFMVVSVNAESVWKGFSFGDTSSAVKIQADKLKMKYLAAERGNILKYKYYIMGLGSFIVRFKFYGNTLRLGMISIMTAYQRDEVSFDQALGTYKAMCTIMKEKFAPTMGRMSEDKEFLTWTDKKHSYTGSVEFHFTPKIVILTMAFYDKEFLKFYARKNTSEKVNLLK